MPERAIAGAAAPRLGRPRGEVRQAIADALRALMAERAKQPLQGTTGALLVGATWPELMQRACVSWDASQIALDNMVRGREVAAIGKARVAGYRRALTVYAPAQALAPAWARGFASVDQAMAAMCRQHG